MKKYSTSKKEKQLLIENEQLQIRLTESEETLNAIRNGAVDAIIVSGTDGEKIFSLASAETPYRIFVEEMNEGAATLFADGTIVYCNQRFSELISVPSVYLVGSNFKSFVSEDEKQHFDELLHNVSNGKSAGEITYTTPDGTVKYFLISLSQMPSNMLGEICVIAKDITGRKIAENSLRESEEKFRNFFEHTIVGKSITGVDGSIIVNKAFCDILGYSKDELTKKKWQEITYQNDIEESAKIVQLLIDGKQTIARFEKRYIHKNGNIVWADVGTVLQKDSEGNPLYFITAIYDITDRKKAEEEIKKLNVELELRVRQRTAQLEEANKELEAFSYSVSHDLRAPLRHISGYVDLLTKRFHDSLPEKEKHYLDSIADSTNQMGELIDDLLQFSRTGRQELKFINFDMNKVLNEAIEQVMLENRERNIEWTITILPNVFGDRTLLRLVWINLLSNAVKFTRKKDKAYIEIHSYIENEENVFSIKDNGVGFDMKYSQKLFGVFQRLHSTQDFEGTGIGLANVRRIILKHNGRTWAEAELENLPAGIVGGASFYFTLPIYKETTQ